MIDTVTKVELPYVTSFRDRHGKLRIYFRHKGKKTALPSDTLSVEFSEKYAALRAKAEEVPDAAKAERKRHGPGSFGALVKEYLASPEYRDKAATTRKEYRRVMEKLAAEHGHKLVTDIEARHIRRMRNERADTPGAANTVLSTMKLILSWAIENDWPLKANPAHGVRPYKLGEWRAWTTDELTAFEARWKPGSMQRRAYALLRYTGQRRTDVAGMTRGHIDGTAIRVKQSKTVGRTGDELWVPMHSALRAELALMELGHLSLLTTNEGKAFDPIYFGAWMAEAIEAAGLPEECVTHGLRKVAGGDLAEAGCSEFEIMAITGLVTLRMAQHYTKSASRKKMAKAAIVKLERAGKRKSKP